MFNHVKRVDRWLSNYPLPLFRDIQTLDTILDKLNGTSGPPLPPNFNAVKMARFALRASSSLLRWGRGLIVPFYTVQDCRLWSKWEVYLLNSCAAAGTSGSQVLHVLVVFLVPIFAQGGAIGSATGSCTVYGQGILFDGGS